MKKSLLVFCIAGALLTSGCNQKVVSPPVKFTDCKNTKLEWKGSDMCAQEGDSNHYNSPAVQISMGSCQGIHITHTKDSRLDLLLRRENSNDNCPLNPFQNAFPYDSGNGNKTDFDTGQVTDKNAIGCGYEIHLLEKKNLGKCDPHIDINQ